MSMFKRSIAGVLFLGLALIASPVFAQCGCGVATSTYVSAAPSYTSYYVPTTTYYAPESYNAYYAPTTAYYAPESYTTYYAPTTTYYAPVPYATYYAPTTAYYAAAPYTTYYSPVAQPYYVGYRDAIGPSIYGTPKVYVRGEPVRNALRAITP